MFYQTKFIFKNQLYEKNSTFRSDMKPLDTKIQVTTQKKNDIEA